MWKIRSSLEEVHTTLKELIQLSDLVRLICTTPNLTIQDMDFYALDAGTSVLKTQILRILFQIKAKAVQ